MLPSDLLVSIVCHADTWTLLQVMQTNKLLREMLLHYDGIWSICLCATHTLLNCLNNQLRLGFNQEHLFVDFVHKMSTVRATHFSDPLVAHPIKDHVTSIMYTSRSSQHASALGAVIPQADSAEVTQMYVCAYKNMLALRTELDMHLILLYKCVRFAFRSEAEFPHLLTKPPYSFLCALQQMQSLLAVSKSELKIRVPQTGRSLLKNIRMLHNLLCTMLQFPNDMMRVCNVNDLNHLQKQSEYILFRRILRRFRFIYTNLNRIVHVIS